MTVVGLDLTCLEAATETGVERYARRLAETLPRVAADIELVIMVRPGRPTPTVSGNARVVSAGPAVPRALWREAVLPGIVERHGIQVVHAPVAAVTTLISVPRVVTIHDLPDGHRVPGEGGLFSRHRLRARHALAVASAFIVPSSATRDALIALDPTAAPRTTVIAHGVDGDFCPVGPALNRARYGIPAGRYILTLGTLRARKDPVTTLHAFAALVAGHGRDLRLVLAGRIDMDIEELRDAAQALHVLDRVVFPGYVAREDIADLIREACVFVLPSRVEGFGIPLIEAMATGTPVVAAAAGAMPEVVGDAGLLVQPGDSDALAAAIATIVDDDTLRDDLRARGLARARQFTWEASALRHADVYRSLV